MEPSPVRRLPGSTLFLLATAAAVNAQSRPLSDSVMALNRAGKWELAGPIAVRGMQSATSPDERCTLALAALYAAAKTMRYNEGTRELKPFEERCGGTAVAKTYPEEIAFIHRELTLPPMPTAGVDWSAVDQFWMAVDTLSRDIEPSPEQWRALLTSPGYRIATISHPNIGRAIEIAFKPSRRAARDSILSRRSEDSATVAHLLVAAAARDELRRFRAVLEPVVVDTIAYATRNASRFLPTGAVDHAPPLVTFSMFASDGYAQAPGIVLDLYHVRENGLGDFLSHEFHHSFASRLDRTTTGQTAPDARFYQAIRQLKNEGIADMIDKAQHPLVTTPGMKWYGDAYNVAYDKTPATLKVIDSLLVAAGGDSAKLVDAGARAQRLLIYGSHPNGAYMAHTILEVFGRDSVIAAIPSAFVFVRMYEAAEAKRGHASPFSTEGHTALSAMESRHVKP